MRSRVLVLSSFNIFLCAIAVVAFSSRGIETTAAPEPREVIPAEPDVQIEPLPSEPASLPKNHTWVFEGWAWMFEGSPNSLVELCIGEAEGTRTYDGGKTSAYEGHYDPGNGVWNRGTFSYQHGPGMTAAQADQAQLNRLKRQAKVLLDQANPNTGGTGLVFTVDSFLNALDLANQSPTSGLGSKVRPRSRGFVNVLTDRVVGGKAVNGDYSDVDIIEARVGTYIDPQTGGWTSTGLRKIHWNLAIATPRDQSRRYTDCKKAIDHYRSQGRMPEGW